MVRQYGQGTPEEHKQFYDWVIARGGFVHSDVNLFKMFPDGSRGIAANVDFQEGEPLMLIPMDACIHMSETPLGEALDDDDVRLRIPVQLTLCTPCRTEHSFASLLQMHY